MAHLAYTEMLSCVDSFLVALFGPENYHRWKSIKQQVSVESEKEFVSWLLDTAEQCYAPQLPKLTPKPDYGQQVAGAAPQEYVAPATAGVGGGGGGQYTSSGNTELQNFFYENGVSENKPSPAQTGIRCKKCDETFSNKSALKSHTKTAHSRVKLAAAAAGPRQYKCEQCYKVYTTKQGLVTHRNVIHNRVKSMRCQFCEVTFLTRREKLGHEQAVHPEQVRVHACEECGKAFTERCTMLKHARFVHQNIKNHKCRFCDKGFHQASDAKKHEANVHLGVKAFACISCDKKFTTKTTMVYHYQREHGNLPPPPVTLDSVATPVSDKQRARGQEQQRRQQQQLMDAQPIFLT